MEVGKKIGYLLRTISRLHFSLSLGSFGILGAYLSGSQSNPERGPPIRPSSSARHFVLLRWAVRRKPLGRPLRLVQPIP